MRKTIGFLISIGVATTQYFMQGGHADCNQAADKAKQVKGCTRIIENTWFESNKNRAIAYSNRGNAYASQGNHDGAIADYVEAIKLDASYANAFYNRAISHTAKGDIDKAIADYDMAIKTDAKHSKAYLNRGRLLLRKGDKARALEDFGKSIGLDPNLALALSESGWALRCNEGSRQRLG